MMMKTRRFFESCCKIAFLPLISVILQAMANNEFDVAVIGGGPIGLATAYECAKAGKKVILFERFVFFNQSGSSNEFARMYRTMYTEDFMADFMYYAIDAWKDLAKDSGEGELIWKTGLLNFGDPNYGAGGPEGTLIGPIPNLRRKQLDYRILTSKDITDQYPIRNLPENFLGVFASENGVINVPLLLRSLHRLCATYGVKLVQNANVGKVTTNGHGSEVHVTVGDFQPQIVTSRKVAITSGAYVNHILEPSYEFKLNINIWEMVYAYYSVNPGPKGTLFPSMWFQFLDNDDNDSRKSNLIYGFPVLPWGPPNLCRIAVDNATNIITDPEERGLQPSCNDLYRTKLFLQKHVPDAVLQPAMSGTCLQTNLPDNMYGLGYVPEKYFPNGGYKSVVVFTAGWAMKAVPLIGKIVHELLDENLEKYNPHLAEIVYQYFSLERSNVIVDDSPTNNHTTTTTVQELISAKLCGSSQSRQLIPLSTKLNITGYSRKNPRALVALALLKRLYPPDRLHLLRDPTRSAITTNRPLSIGIVGAGMAGLYAAMLLKSLGIPYHILEANPDRCGGRVFTYRFNRSTFDQYTPNDPDYYNYIDMGAMRFPPLDIMDRVIGGQEWSLTTKLNKFASVNGLPPLIRLIPYSLSDPKNFNLFNGILLQNQDITGDSDYFKFSDSLNGGPGTAVPDEFVKIGSGKLLDYAVGPFLETMKQDFGNGFDQLMQYDSFSTRQYLALKVKYPNNPNPCLGYPQSVINWIETNDTGSGLFDQAFTETVVDSFDFEEKNEDVSQWQCVEGGMDRFVHGMLRYLDASDPSLNDDEVRPNKKARRGTTESTPVGSFITNGCLVKKIAPTDSQKLRVDYQYNGMIRSNEYDHVINTVPLSVNRTIDLSACDLTLRQRDAIRLMHYDFSCKLALKFKSRFWQKDFKGGVSNTDNPLRVIVYPSYGIDLPNAPGVMIASYTWSQDASRIAAMFGSTGGNDTHDQHTQRRTEALETCLQFLGEVHGYDIVKREFTGEYFFQDWYDDPYAQGAFALYGPAQFQELFPHIVQPAASGLLHFAGEATSVHHAWIIGALNSAYRSVYQILDQENLTEKKDLLVEKWGVVEEVEYGDYQPQPPPEPQQRPRRLLAAAAATTSAGTAIAAAVSGTAAPAIKQIRRRFHDKRI